MKILIVNGAPRSGKDLFCQAAFSRRELIYPISTIDETKKLAKLLGWDGVKDERGRKFLSDLKDAMSTYNDLPRKYVLKRIYEKCDMVDTQASTYTFLSDSHQLIFLVQAREPKEIERWVKENNARTLYVVRKQTQKEWGNHADDAAMNYHYDYYLSNDGTIEEWLDKSVNFIDKIRKEGWESHV